MIDSALTVLRREHRAVLDNKEYVELVQMFVSLFYWWFAQAYLLFRGGTQLESLRDLLKLGQQNQES